MRISLGDLKRVLHEANRDRRTGKYSYDADFERLCACGHTLGVHAGEPPHPCFNDDTGIVGATGQDCACERFRPARRTVTEVSDPPGGWKYFHITWKDMGPTFTFTPYIPNWVKSCEAEDFTTRRVSLATSVEAAIRGKFGSTAPIHFAQPEMFVYAARRISHLVIPKSGEGIDDPDNPWGNDWSYRLYAEAHGLDPNDKTQHAEVVRGRISDDPKESKEVWSLSPIKMVLVSRVWLDDDRKRTKIKQKNKLRIADVDDEEDTQT